MNGSTRDNSNVSRSQKLKLAVINQVLKKFQLTVETNRVMKTDLEGLKKLVT